MKGKDPRVEDPGIYKARAVRWMAKQSRSSEACAITVKFWVKARLHEGAWEPCDEAVVWGDFWVVGKHGETNEKVSKNLHHVLGWDGSLDVDGPVPTNQAVQVTVKGEEYQGKTYYKVSWLNRGDYVPEKKKRKDAPDGKALDKKHGAALKRTIGSATRDDARDEIDPDSIPF